MGTSRRHLALNFMSTCRRRWLRSRRCYSRVTVWINDAPKTRSWRSLAAVAAVVGVLLVTVEIGSSSVGASTPHLPHSLSVSAGERFAVVVDHSHFEDGSDPSAPPTLTAAVLPRGAAAALVMLGVFAAVAIFARFSTLPSLVPVRGPPRTGQVVGAGRDLLIRFCVDRC